MKPPSPAAWRLAGWAAALSALAATFAAYLQPDAVMALATRVWACF